MHRPSEILKIGFKELHNGNYPKAIEAFNQLNSLEENWQCYQGLGSALDRIQQHQSAVDAFNK